MRMKSKGVGFSVIALYCLIVFFVVVLIFPILYDPLDQIIESGEDQSTGGYKTMFQNLKVVVNAFPFILMFSWAVLLFIVALARAI
ncbi:MAG TPA: hypothetical protein ENF66_00330 [Firmicutes bacterium]|nr:hypothetical protein [Bacillota bacterium]